MKIRKNDAEKVAYGIAGMAGGALAMKAIEKAINSQAVSGLLGLEGVATLQEIAPPIAVGIIGTGFYSQNRNKAIGYAGLGAAMAAGAKVVEKVSNKTIFSGLGETGAYVIDDTPALPEIAGDDPYYYDEEEDLPYAGVDGVEDDDVEIL